MHAWMVSEILKLVLEVSTYICVTPVCKAHLYTRYKKQERSRSQSNELQWTICFMNGSSSSLSNIKSSEPYDRYNMY
jgi:hypothetical protein